MSGLVYMLWHQAEGLVSEFVFVFPPTEAQINFVRNQFTVKWPAFPDALMRVREVIVIAGSELPVLTGIVSPGSGLPGASATMFNYSVEATGHVS